jgi:hypothetical protein
VRHSPTHFIHIYRRTAFPPRLIERTTADRRNTELPFAPRVSTSLLNQRSPARRSHCIWSLRTSGNIRTVHRLRLCTPRDATPSVLKLNKMPTPALASPIYGAHAHVLRLRSGAGAAEQGHFAAFLGACEPHSCVHFCWCVAGCCNRRAASSVDARAVQIWQLIK